MHQESAGSRFRHRSHEFFNPSHPYIPYVQMLMEQIHTKRKCRQTADSIRPFPHRDVPMPCGSKQRNGAKQAEHIIIMKRNGHIIRKHPRFPAKQICPCHGGKRKEGAARITPPCPLCRPQHGKTIQAQVSRHKIYAQEPAEIIPEPVRHKIKRHHAFHSGKHQKQPGKHNLELPFPHMLHRGIQKR